MINGKSILAVIPARGGSKGVPRKNIREIAGKPLLAWTSEEARKSRYIDRLILSSEDDEIISIGKKWGCEVPFKRPPELATDEAPAELVVYHALENLPGFDYVLLLQVTSPLRTVRDIDVSLELCESRQGKGCVSVTEAEKSPYWMFTVDDLDRIYPLMPSGYRTKRRQELPLVYALNGAIFLAQTKHYLRERTFQTPDTVAYKMPPERSLDLDTEFDFIIMESILARKEG
jgi:CMP-N,N'-diacetyllegionaminic acid synthase